MSAAASVPGAARRPQRALDMLLLLAGFLILWQGLHVLAGSVALSSPAETIERALTMLGTTRFWGNVAETMKAFVYALAISSLGGVAIGLLLGAHRLSGTVAEPILVALYALPKVTLYPLVLLVFGLGLSAKVAFGAMHGVIPVAIFAMNAVRNLSPVLTRTARAMRLSPWQTVSTVLMPAALPEIVTGLRIGFSLTFLGVLIGEMFASQRGLGFAIMNAIGLNDVETIMAVTLLIAIFAVASNALLLRLDRRLHR